MIALVTFKNSLQLWAGLIICPIKVDGVRVLLSLNGGFKTCDSKVVASFQKRPLSVHKGPK